MALKTLGKRRAARNDESEGEENDEQTLVKEQRRDMATLKGGKLPPSIGMERLRQHVAGVFVKYAELIPVHRLFDTGGMPSSGAVTTYHPAYTALTFEALATSPLILTEQGLSARLGLSPQTWSRWKEQNPELEQAVVMGMSVQGENLAARGIEDRINVAGLIMAMKNSAHRWRDKVEHDIGENIADLIRRAEENKRTVQWEDIGGYRDKLPKAGSDVIDVESGEGVATDEQGRGEEQGGGGGAERAKRAERDTAAAE